MGFPSPDQAEKGKQPQSQGDGKGGQGVAALRKARRKLSIMSDNALVRVVWGCVGGGPRW